MTTEQLFSMYDFNAAFSKALAMDIAGDMQKLNDEDFVIAWKKIGNIENKVVGIENSVRIYPFIRDRMGAILSAKVTVDLK